MRLQDFVNVQALGELTVKLPKSTKAVATVQKLTITKCYNTFEEYIQNENVKPLKGGGKVAISNSIV